MDKKGLGFALGAYGLWGLLPIYWKLLLEVPALEILLHRMVWSLVFLGGLLLLSGRWRRLRGAWGEPRTRWIYLGASLLIAANWGIYIWAVNSGFVVETSLGYFINPLVNVFLGVVVFHEKLRLGQWSAIGLAAVGVVYLTLTYGRLPWISLSLALLFAIYAVLKKIAPLPAVEGLTFETALMFLPAVAVLIVCQISDSGSFTRLSGATDLLLIGSGVATAVPLVFFAAAAQRLPLSLIGVLQYIAPVMQLLLGVLVYGEPFDRQRLVGFAFIWLALLVFTVEGVVSRGRSGQRDF